jgi:hypothetical protein
MLSPRAPASPLPYALAIFIGLCAFWFASSLAQTLRLIFYAEMNQFDLAGPLALAFCYAVAGFAFGYELPERRWRWGIWLSVFPTLFSFVIPGVAFSILIASTLLPACAGSYAGARLSRKYMGVS